MERSEILASNLIGNRSDMMMPWRSGNSTCKWVLHKLQTLYLGGVEVEKEVVAVL